MPRVYPKLGPSRLAKQIRIPITAGTEAYLERLARDNGIDKTNYARNLLLEAIGPIPDDLASLTCD